LPWKCPGKVLEFEAPVGVRTLLQLYPKDPHPGYDVEKIESLALPAIPCQI